MMSFIWSVNAHMRIKIYREFYHCIIYIAKEECHIRITDLFLESMRFKIVLIITFNKGDLQRPGVIRTPLNRGRF